MACFVVPEPDRIADLTQKGDRCWWIIEIHKKSRVCQNTYCIACHYGITRRHDLLIVSGTVLTEVEVFKQVIPLRAGRGKYNLGLQCCPRHNCQKEYHSFHGPIYFTEKLKIFIISGRPCAADNPAG